MSTPFVSRDDTHAYLTGVYVHWKDDAAAYVATDGHKMCLAQPYQPSQGLAEVFDTTIAEHDGVIITAEDAKELTGWAVKRSSIEAEGFALMEIHPENRLVFKSCDCKKNKISRAFDATYPDYMRCVPKPDAQLKAEEVGFNAHYLALIEKVGKAGFTHASGCSVKAHFYGQVS